MLSRSASYKCDYNNTMYYRPAERCYLAVSASAEISDNEWLEPFENVTLKGRAPNAINHSAPEIEMFRMLTGALILAVLAVATPAEEVSTVRYNGGSESPVSQRRRPENDTANVGTEKSLSHREIRTMPAPWAADMFYRALANFTVHEDVGTAACRKQTQMYLRHLKNNTYWAVKSEYAYLSILSVCP